MRLRFLGLACAIALFRSIAIGRLENIVLKEADGGNKASWVNVGQAFPRTKAEATDSYVAERPKSRRTLSWFDPWTQYSDRHRHELVPETRNDLMSRAAIPVTSKTALATMNTTTRNPGSLTGTKTTQAESAACYQVGSCVLQDSHAKDPYLISWEICRGMAAAILRTRPSVARCLHAILPEEEKGVVSTTTMTTVHILAMTADIAAC